jgi:hypothetical protein
VTGEMVMGKVGGAWSARSFAGPAHVEAVENIRARLANAGVPAGSTMLVRVPALNIEFVAYRDTTGMKLTPVTDLAAAGLTGADPADLARIQEAIATRAAAQRHAVLRVITAPSSFRMRAPGRPSPGSGRGC